MLYWPRFPSEPKAGRPSECPHTQRGGGDPAVSFLSFCACPGRTACQDHMSSGHAGHADSHSWHTGQMLGFGYTTAIPREGRVAGWGTRQNVGQSVLGSWRQGWASVQAPHSGFKCGHFNKFGAVTGWAAPGQGAAQGSTTGRGCAVQLLLPFYSQFPSISFRFLTDEQRKVGNH